MQPGVQAWKPCAQGHDNYKHSFFGHTDSASCKGSRERLPGDPLDLGKIIVDEPSLGRGVALAHRVWPKLLS